MILSSSYRHFPWHVQVHPSDQGSFGVPNYERLFVERKASEEAYLKQQKPESLLHSDPKYSMVSLHVPLVRSVGREDSPSDKAHAISKVSSFAFTTKVVSSSHIYAESAAVTGKPIEMGDYIPTHTEKPSDLKDRMTALTTSISDGLGHSSLILPKEQRAIVTPELAEKLQARLSTIAVRDPNPGEAIVSLEYSGICRSVSEADPHQTTQVVRTLDCTRLTSGIRISHSQRRPIRRYAVAITSLAMRGLVALSRPTTPPC